MFSYAYSDPQCLPDGPCVPFRTCVCRNHRLALELYCAGDCPACRADSRMIVDAATRTGRGRRKDMSISACKARPSKNPPCGMSFLIFRPQDENDKLNWKLMPSQICAHTRGVLSRVKVFAIFDRDNSYYSTLCAYYSLLLGWWCCS